MDEVNTKRQHYPALDGLRGIAILLVVFYHNFGFLDYFFFGWLGVDLFFVLSGFLITDILLHSRGRSGFVGNFYMRRLLRIAPLYYLSLVVFLLIIPRLNLPDVDFDFYIIHQWWFWTFLQNWLLMSMDASDHTIALHHFWSLAVEEQFYLVWPWLLLAVKRPGTLLIIMLSLLIAVVTARSIIWFHELKDFNYFGFYTFSRIDGLCIGSMVAVLNHMHSRILSTHIPAIVLTLAGLNFLFYFINRENNFSFPYLAMIGYTTFSVIFALLAFQAISGESRIIQMLLQTGVLRFFGKYSFGIYIFHWPVYLLLNPLVKEWLLNLNGMEADIAGILSAVLLSLASVALAMAVFHGYEKHFLKLKYAFR